MLDLRREQLEDGGATELSQQEVSQTVVVHYSYMNNSHNNINNAAYSSNTYYDNIINHNLNQLSQQAFYSCFDTNLNGLKILDLGVGSGEDPEYLKKHHNAKQPDLYGIDEQINHIKKAKEKLPDANFIVNKIQDIQQCWPNQLFDIICSKHVIQVLEKHELDTFYKNVHSKLAEDGWIIFLISHPQRQYLELPLPRDHFSVRDVISTLKSNVVLKEPLHMFQDYLTDEFFKLFDFRKFREGLNEAAVQAEGEKYATFFIIKAQKRKNE